jgi:hypothetical protein
MNIDQSYDNAYQLLLGNISYEDLGEEFYLPTDHENADILIRHYEQEEHYERCAIIRDNQINNYGKEE